MEPEILLKKIDAQIEAEDYIKALEIVKSSGPLDELVSIPSDIHRDLSVLFAKVHYYNHDYRQAGLYLSGLTPLYKNLSCHRDYIFVRSQLYLMEGEPEKALRQIDEALCHEEAGWSRNDEFFLKFCLGKSHFWKGDYLNANLHFQACYQFYGTGNHQMMLGNVLYMLGYTAFQRCFFDQADSFYRKAIGAFRSAGSNSQLAATFHMIGILSYRTGKYSIAEEYLLQSRKYFKKVKSNPGIIESYIAQGRVKMFRNDLSQAFSLISRARERAGESGYKRGTALALEFMGEIEHRRNNYDRSLFYLVEAEKLALEIAPNGDIAVEVFRRLGELYTSMGRLKEATEILGKALELSKYLHDDYELACILRTYALVESKMNNPELSRSYFSEAISLFSIIKERNELASTYITAAKIYIDYVTSSGQEIKDTRIFLDEAREFSTEAAHLYDALELPEPCALCEEFSNRLMNDFYQKKELSGYEEISFKPSWLYDGFVVARSDHMRKIVKKASSFAPSTMPVLITGETGTGKEIIAKLLHQKSTRESGPFVAVNCASIPGSVFESEMFGHRKGAFTGADRDHIGLIEMASGGTLFLDEISELTLSQQAKLLRVFQEQKIRRIGESIERTIDVRLVSASNQNMELLLRDGSLRQDFYYRVLTANIEIEPLRRRKNDIEALFAYYMLESGCESKIEEGVTDLLKSYYWPGNVRQLISVVRVLALIGNSRSCICKNDLPLKIRNYPIFGAGHTASESANILKTKDIPSIGLTRNRDDIKQLIISSLLKYNGNKSATARGLGISRSTLYRTLKDIGIS
ncbi:MAG: sigma 54-interacting transcriptional regulator [Candidatus Krumholzibacteriota bacterium]|nr:sigma 54-interacting transcriptional regulator [Candidatus Krumholzibacteriota bacterium]